MATESDKVSLSPHEGVLWRCGLLAAALSGDAPVSRVFARRVAQELEQVGVRVLGSVEACKAIDQGMAGLGKRPLDFEIIGGTQGGNVLMLGSDESGPLLILGPDDPPVDSEGIVVPDHDAYKGVQLTRDEARRLRDRLNRELVEG